VAIECVCKSCVGACSVKPGWFMPGEVEKAAAFLHMTAQDFFDKYLAVDYWTSEENPTFILSPAIVGIEPGEMYPMNPHGQCVFFKDDRCSIHPVKPFECRELACNDTRATTQPRHDAVAEAWKGHQKEVLALYPEASMPDMTMMDLFSMLFGALP